jgi:hypothetical protein
MKIVTGILAFVAAAVLGSASSAAPVLRPSVVPQATATNALKQEPLQDGVTKYSWLGKNGSKHELFFRNEGDFYKRVKLNDGTERIREIKSGQRKDSVIFNIGKNSKLRKLLPVGQSAIRSITRDASGKIVRHQVDSYYQTFDLLKGTVWNDYNRTESKF